MKVDTVLSLIKCNKILRTHNKLPNIREKAILLLKKTLVSINKNSSGLPPII
jgi:hypothetical protein